MLMDRQLSAIELFAGIGGFRVALDAEGYETRYVNEADPKPFQTYLRNHEIIPRMDCLKLQDIDADRIPDADLVVGGFPCQPHSRAGRSKNRSLGREVGFADEERGRSVIAAMLEVANKSSVQAVLFENARDLATNNSGMDLRLIQSQLSDCGFFSDPVLLNGRLVVPQRRERLYLIGFRRGRKALRDFHGALVTELERLPPRDAEFVTILEPFEKVDSKYWLTENLWAYLLERRQSLRSEGRVGFNVYNIVRSGVAPTLPRRYYKDGSDILVWQGKRNTPRRLTPRECARLMGFPDRFELPDSDNQAYQQLGNAVIPAIVQILLRAMRGILDL